MKYGRVGENTFAMLRVLVMERRKIDARVGVRRKKPLQISRAGGHVPQPVIFGPPLWPDDFFQVAVRLARKRNGREKLTRKPADWLVRQPINFGQNVSEGGGIGNFFVVRPEPFVFYRQDFLRAVFVRPDVENHLVFLPVIARTIRADVAQKVT